MGYQDIVQEKLLTLAMKEAINERKSALPMLVVIQGERTLALVVGPAMDPDPPKRDEQLRLLREFVKDMGASSLVYAADFYYRDWSVAELDRFIRPLEDPEAESMVIVSRLPQMVSTLWPYHVDDNGIVQWEAPRDRNMVPGQLKPFVEMLGRKTSLNRQVAALKMVESELSAIVLSTIEFLP